MMKKMLWTLILLSCFSLTYAQVSTTEKNEALNFNDYIAEITDSVYNYGREWGTNVLEVKESKSYHKLSTIRKKLQTFLDKKQMEVLRYKTSPGLDKTKLAIINFLAIEKLILQTGMMRFEYLNSDSTQEEIDYEFNNLTEVALFEEEYMQTLKAVLEEMANTYGYTIAPE